ncbi:UNVERIFIED_CONTAM: IQ domain-containing protein IQM3 [Sesamum latifolium]|uniref:IQ domain-containing protein IQM3 n=1 Tax=Sesamum latifolium TaxID=2727402 RepID=A0AAW2VFE7_9LAMI
MLRPRNWLSNTGLKLLDVGDGKWVNIDECPRSRLLQECISYLGPKKKGRFHHSSFLAGGATLAAGRLAAECGSLKSISAYSGHYRPTDENLSIFLAFLQNSGVNLAEVQNIRAMMLIAQLVKGKTRLPTESEQPSSMNPMIALQQSPQLCRLSKGELKWSQQGQAITETLQNSPNDDTPTCTKYMHHNYSDQSRVNLSFPFR